MLTQFDKISRPSAYIMWVSSVVIAQHLLNIDTGQIEAFGIILPRQGHVRITLVILIFVLLYHCLWFHGAYSSWRVIHEPRITPMRELLGLEKTARQFGSQRNMCELLESLEQQRQHPTGLLIPQVADDLSRRCRQAADSMRAGIRIAKNISWSDKIFLFGFNCFLPWLLAVYALYINILQIIGPSHSSKIFLGGS